MATELKVEVIKILDISEHTNAERLELATIKGWQCVVQKGVYKKGDLIVYIPIDSILPLQLEEIIFGEDSKVKLSNSRVRSIKLRGEVSQGLVVPLVLLGVEGKKEGVDLTKQLGITKYTPPTRSGSFSQGCSTKSTSNRNFPKYTSITNIKNLPNKFCYDEFVYVSEKLHGTNSRFGNVKTNVWWKKLLSLFGMHSGYDFVFGSHNVVLPKSLLNKPKGTNVWVDAVSKYKLQERIPKDTIIYGEIIGDGVQANYSYGVGSNDRVLRLFDVKCNGEYLNVQDFYKWCSDFGFKPVSLIWEGLYNFEAIKKVTSGKSLMFPKSGCIMEGGVIKNSNYQLPTQRKIMKLINDKYLLLIESGNIYPPSFVCNPFEQQ